MIGGGELNISTIVKRGVLIVQVEGEMDMHAAEQFRSSVDGGLETSGAKNIIFNLNGVTFIDSSGVGVILGRYKKVSILGGKLAAVNVKPQVARILEFSGLLRIMELFGSESEALDSL